MVIAVAQEEDYRDRGRMVQVEAVGKGYVPAQERETQVAAPHLQNHPDRTPSRKILDGQSGPARASTAAVLRFLAYYSNIMKAYKALTFSEYSYHTILSSNVSWGKHTILKRIWLAHAQHGQGLLILPYHLRSARKRASQVKSDELKKRRRR